MCYSSLGSRDKLLVELLVEHDCVIGPSKDNIRNDISYFIDNISKNDKKLLIEELSHKSVT